ncbi:hypothetical protein D7X96_15990 [Corallococcus interemptor]|uniref:Uncharacterized protein n=1 Tax=Corallococcus interemptor TaxID=2316720 RepID=A0A3A8QJY9_9BACT|nr:hypothetical protein [Corallococcus interemptor]RKH69079.1 hypothetical protein D7X96_15990 [Corallococcus interemptor]
MKRSVRAVTIATLTSNAFLFGFSLEARADSPEIRASIGVTDNTFQGPPAKVKIESVRVRVGNGIDGAVRWVQDQAIDVQIDRALGDAFPRIKDVLSRAAPGSGYLIDIQVYTHSEGQKVFQGPIELGLGPSPADAYALSQKKGGVHTAPPAGLLIDREASFMVWCDLEGGTLSYRRAWRDSVRDEGERKLQAEHQAKVVAEVRRISALAMAVAEKAKAEEMKQAQAAVAFAAMEATKAAEVRRQAEMARLAQQQAADTATQFNMTSELARQAAQAQEFAAQMARQQAAADAARQVQAQAEFDAWAQRQRDEIARQQAEQLRLQQERMNSLWSRPTVGAGGSGGSLTPGPAPSYLLP